MTQSLPERIDEMVYARWDEFEHRWREWSARWDGRMWIEKPGRLLTFVEPASGR